MALHKPTPTLLPPPGPIVQQYRMLPTGLLSPSPTPSSLPPLFLSALSIRYKVFILGQNCNSELEIDADDAVSWHWIIHAPSSLRKEGGEEEGREEGEVPAATIRLVPAQSHAHDGGEGEGGKEEEGGEIEGPNLSGSKLWDGKELFGKIGRLATVEEFRGRGYGRVLVETALRFAGEHGAEMNRECPGWGWKGLVLIHAQVGVRGWYEGLGWVGDEGMGRWVEEGIEHLGMWMRVDVSGGVS